VAIFNRRFEVNMKSEIIARGKRIYLRAPDKKDRAEFIDKAERSRKFLYPWIDIKADNAYFEKYLQKLRGPSEGFLICLNDDSIAGVININEIVRGIFQSGYMGYYLFEQYAGQGYMTDGMRLAIKYAFTKLGLHRLEANIQPENKASIKLVKRLGFRKEGLSPRYLKIGGRWCDHERWALLKEYRIKSQG